MTTPVMIVGRAEPARRASFAHPWVEHRVQHVAEEIEGDDRERDEEEDALQHRVIAPAHGLDDREPDAGPAEDRFYQDAPAMTQPSVSVVRVTSGSIAERNASRQMTRRLR